MKKIVLLIILLICSLFYSSQAQFYVHVKSSSLNLRQAPSTSSNIVKRLGQYDNLVVSDTIAGNWINVTYGIQKGYVHTDYVKSGRAKVTTVQGGRIGAVCKDGTTSSATGRGACSHHGGVSYWRYSQHQSVTIIENK